MSKFFREIRWARVWAAFLVAEVATIAAAFGWVAIYSHLLNPGRDLAHYEAYAMTASPYVSLFAGPPIFYSACRWIWANGLAVFLLYCILEIAFLLFSDTSSIPKWILYVGFPAKFLACWLGGRTAK